MVGKINQTEKDKYYIISLICGISYITKQVNKQTNNQKNRNSITNVQNRLQTGGCHMGGSRRMGEISEGV